MPQEGLTDDEEVALLAEMAGFECLSVTTAIAASGFAAAAALLLVRHHNLGRMHHPHEVVHLLDVHLAHVTKVVPSPQFFQSLPHFIKVEIPTGEVIPVRAGGAGESRRERGGDRRPSQHADRGGEDAVQDFGVVDFGQGSTYHGTRRRLLQSGSMVFNRLLLLGLLSDGSRPFAPFLLVLVLLLLGLLRSGGDPNLHLRPGIIGQIVRRKFLPLPSIVPIALHLNLGDLPAPR
mmetsp:Transcript_25353/g.74603  ORF Transcript_25353/g.74603 Transcript_25353/m.74603 type:complete len:234 (-) Transcript_25353:1145-1846(-)